MYLSSKNANWNILQCQPTSQGHMDRLTQKVPEGGEVHDDAIEGDTGKDVTLSRMHKTHQHTACNNRHHTGSTTGSMVQATQQAPLTHTNGLTTGICAIAAVLTFPASTPAQHVRRNAGMRDIRLGARDKMRRSTLPQGRKCALRVDTKSTCQ